MTLWNPGALVRGQLFSPAGCAVLIVAGSMAIGAVLGASAVLAGLFMGAH
jgi:NifU-like protein involved in Fe-S cluster formation